MTTATKQAPSVSAGTSLSEQIREWAQHHDWYSVNVQTNQLRLEQAFGHAIESVAKDLDYQNQHRMSRQIFNCYDLLSAKCRKIDMVCRSGCQSRAELLELEFLRTKAIAVAIELAEVLDLLKRIQKSGNLRTQEIPDSVSTARMTKSDEWITFSEAAGIIGVTKGTISKWATDGKFTDNGQQGQKRRLLKTSVLAVKLEKEDEDLKKDISELRQDARKLG